VPANGYRELWRIRADMTMPFRSSSIVKCRILRQCHATTCPMLRHSRLVARGSVVFTRGFAFDDEPRGQNQRTHGELLAMGGDHFPRPARQLVRRIGSLDLSSSVMVDSPDHGTAWSGRAQHRARSQGGHQGTSTARPPDLCRDADPATPGLASLRRYSPRGQINQTTIGQAPSVPRVQDRYRPDCRRWSFSLVIMSIVGRSILPP